MLYYDNGKKPLDNVRFIRNIGINKKYNHEMVLFAYWNFVNVDSKSFFKFALILTLPVL